MNIGSKLTVARNVVTSKAGRQVLKAQKHSPHILFGAGVVGVVATTVLACRATLKLEEILDEHDAKNKLAEQVANSGDERYSPQDLKRDQVKLKTRLVVDVSRLYLPAILVGTASVCALGGSHVILTKRNTGLMAAYATLDRSFKEFQDRVEEQYGPDAVRELKHGVEEREVAVDTDKGTKVETIKGYRGASQYARIWDKDTAPNAWSPQSEYNLVTLRAHQAYANDQLQMKGHVLLNDVYDMLGLSRTKAGCVVGWVKGHGDDYIDFGIYHDRNQQQFADFITGREQAILLDFNVDGVVYDLI